MLVLIWGLRLLKNASQVYLYNLDSAGEYIATKEYL